MSKAERYRRLAKEGFWIVLGQTLTVMGALVGVRLLTELLTPHAYGELALGMTIAILVNQIFLGPLAGGITRFYAPAAEHGDLGGYLNSVKKLLLYATAIIFLLGVIAAIGLFVAGQAQWISITVSAIIFAVLNGYCANISGVQSAARQRSIVAIHQGADTLLRALIAAVIIFLFGATSTFAMIGYAVSSLVVLGSQIIFFRKIIASKVNITNHAKEWQGKIWQYTWPIGTFGIFTWMQLSSDRWALQIFSSTKEVGSYAVLYQLGYYPITLFTGMAMQFLEPILFQRAGDASDSKRNAGVHRLSWNLVWISLGVTAVAFLVALIFHAQIFGILVAEEYRATSYLLPWLIVSGGVFASGQALSALLQAHMKTREMMTVKIVTAILGVILNFTCVYILGITGVVYAGVLFSILHLLWIMSLVNKGRNKCF
jgi:O-antigen/teichoic acid export membrane protein